MGQPRGERNSRRSFASASLLASDRSHDRHFAASFAVAGNCRRSRYSSSASSITSYSLRPSFAASTLYSLIKSSRKAYPRLTRFEPEIGSCPGVFCMVDLHFLKDGSLSFQANSTITVQQVRKCQEIFAL